VVYTSYPPAKLQPPLVGCFAIGVQRNDKKNAGEQAQNRCSLVVMHHYI
jgi:hypothetical protein